MEIVKNVHLIKGRGIHLANVYLITGKELILIDTGMPGRAEKILAYVSELGFGPRDISTVLLTHSHIDHAGSAFELKRRTKAQVAVHRADAPFVEGKKKFHFLLRALSWISRYKPVKVDVRLEDGDRIGDLTVIHTPGHTPGSICLSKPKQKVLFTDDLIRVSRGKIKGPFRFSSSDIRLAKSSIKKISRLDFETLFPGHGDPIKSGASTKVRDFVISLD